MESHNWKVIVLMGVPGSGKGTEAQILSHLDPKYIHISTGQLLRDLENDPSADVRDKALLHQMKEGKLVDDTLVYRLAFDAIEKTLSENHVAILDGAIRSVNQAMHYEKFFEEKGIEKDVAIIEIQLSDDISFKRLTTRKVCADCGYIIPYSIDNFKKTLCEKCGGALMVRTDDHPETVIKRIEAQGNKVLQPILDYYKQVGTVFSVDGNRSIPEVDVDIRKILGISP